MKRVEAVERKDLYLFIFESIGTSELMLIGLVALIFLGPRKLPEMARKMGKMMNEFKATTNEFKSTWEREVNFEEEASALRTGELPPVPANENTIHSQATTAAAPEIRSIDREAFEALAPAAIEQSREIAEPDRSPAERNELSDKRSWL